MNTKTKQKEKISANLLPAMYFGFDVISPLEVTNENIKITKQNAKDKKFLHAHLFPFEEIVTLLKNYKENSDSASQMFLAYEGNFGGNHEKHRKSPGKETVNLHIIGTEQSSADALIIQTTESILRGAGHKNLFLKINNIGGKTSQNQFNREATNYYRKYISDLHINARQLFKDGIYHLVTGGQNYNKELQENSPKPMDFLADDARKHFSEVLEYLENLEMSYEIDNSILGDINYSANTVFEISDENTGEILAYGSRYDLIGKKIGIRRDVPAIGVTIKVKEAKKLSSKIVNKMKNSKFFVIQMGNEAKIKALDLIGKMTAEEIFVRHSISRDKISAQLQIAKKYDAEHCLIIGYKEALENSVIVRDAEGRSQKNIKNEELAEYLKKLTS